MKHDLLSEPRHYNKTLLTQNTCGNMWLNLIELGVLITIIIVNCIHDIKIEGKSTPTAILFGVQRNIHNIDIKYSTSGK